MGVIIKSKKLFQHNHVITGYAGGQPYLYYKSNNPYTDGINRGHVRLYGKCDICGEEIMVASIHTDSDGKLYETQLDRDLKTKK